MRTCLLSLALGLAHVPTSDEAARTLALLRTPEHPLKLEGPGAEERSRFVLPLLRAYTELEKWSLELDPALEAALAKTETGLAICGEIARDDVHPLVQGLARERGLRFRFDLAANEPTLQVASVASAQGQHDFEAPIAIPLELLPAWTNHPAFPLAIEIPCTPQSGEALAARLQALLAQSALRTDVARSASGALRVTGSAAVLEFVVALLAEGPKLASDLESATFPPDPNTPAGKAAALLPEHLRATFPAPAGALALRKGEAAPSELDILLEYGRWSQRALLFFTAETRSSLAVAPGGADVPESVPSAWAHEFVSGLLADSGCALTPLPAPRPVLFAVQKHPQGGAAALDPAGLPTIRLAELAAVAHLAATRFQTFVRLPKLEEAQRAQIRALASPDERAPFWITELDDQQVFSLIGTPRAITSAVLALRLSLAPPKPR